MRDRLEDNTFVTLFAIITAFVIICVFMGLLFYTGSDSRETNEKLKREVYELKTRIQKLEKEKLDCILSK